MSSVSLVYLAFMHPLIKGFLNHPVAQRCPFSAVFEILKWQILGSSHELRTIQYGVSSQLAVKKGMAGATGNVYYGLHEFDEMVFLMKAAPPECTFVDVGANIGSYTILLAKECGVSVICFEPNRATFEHLERNVLLNNIESRCELHCKGVGATSGVIGFTEGLDTVNHVARDGEDHVLTPVVALDELQWDKGPLVIKVDVEGFESFVVDGAKELLKSGQVEILLIELNGGASNYGLNELDLFERIQGFGFLPFWYDAKRSRLSSLSEPTATNTLFIHSIHLDEVTLRLQNAPKIVIRGTEW